jgi:hypothetical protein
MTTSVDGSSERSRAAAVLPWVVVCAWLLSTAYGFWHFDLRMQRAFESGNSGTFDADARARAAESWFRAAFEPPDSGHAAATVIHVYAEGCACNGLTDQHLAAIEAAYAGRGVRIVRVAHTAAAAKAAPRWLEVAPAALVFDAGGKLKYFGPYSDASWCGAAGQGLVERALDRVLLRQPQRMQRIWSRGCFCDWNTDS